MLFGGVCDEQFQTMLSARLLNASYLIEYPSMLEMIGIDNATNITCKKSYDEGDLALNLRRDVDRALRTGAALVFGFNGPLSFWDEIVDP